MNLHDRDIKVLAFKEGQLNAKIETAKNLLAKGIPVEVVAECTGLVIEEVEKLIEK